MYEDVSGKRDLNEQIRRNREKGIKIMAMILFLFSMICALIYAELNGDPVNGDVSDKMLATVVCRTSNKTLNDVLISGMANYKLKLKLIHSGKPDRFADDVMTIIDVGGMLRNESGSLEPAKLKIDITGSITSREEDMIIYAAEINGRKITDKSKLAELKNHMCGQTPHRSYI